MKHRVITVGRPSGWAKSAAEEFGKRIGGFAEVELVQVKEGAKQERELLEKSEGWQRVALDEKGSARIANLELGKSESGKGKGSRQ